MQSFSQAGQDLFAAYINSYKKDGYFVDCGSNEHQLGNNSFSLEKELGWRGLAVEYVPYLCSQFNRNRSNPCFAYDLNEKSLTEILDENNSPKIIDYLSHDLDHPEPRINSLKSWDFSKYKIRALTFEHDMYLDGDSVQKQSQEFLADNGMTLVIENVMFGGRKFEDWWVDANLVDEGLWKFLCGKDVEYTEILERIKNERN